MWTPRCSPGEACIECLTSNVGMCGIMCSKIRFNHGKSTTVSQGNFSCVQCSFPSLFLWYGLERADVGLKFGREGCFNRLNLISKVRSFSQGAIKAHELFA